MAKESNVSWRDYLIGYVTAPVDCPIYKQIQKINECLQQVSFIGRGDLRYKNLAKILIKEKTKKFPGSENYPPYCFRFQCLQTGRVSKYIKECDYPLFGITKDEAQTGGSYLDRQNIEDKFRPVFTDLINQSANLWNQIRAKYGSNMSWWERYNEYLRSEEWYEKREQVLFRDRYTCCITDHVSHNNHVHHVSYRNVGNESLDELCTVSPAAHNIIHSNDHPESNKYRNRVQEYLDFYYSIHQ